MLDDRLWLIVCTVIPLFLPSWIVFFTEECSREDFSILGCLDVPMDVYYCVYA